MKLSAVGWYYLAFSTMTGVYFCAAAINGWPGPSFGDGSSGGSHYSSGGGGYIGGYGGSGRSSGGFGGGGK